MGYSASKNNTTLKTESDIVQDHWKWRRSIYDRQWRTNRKSSWAAIVNLVPFSSYLTLNDIVTLKSKLEVTQGHIKWYHSKVGCSFLFAFYSKYGSILHQFEIKPDIGRKSLFFHTLLHSAPPLKGEGSPSEYFHPVWCGKTRMVGLPVV